jgi:hypothetical protein
VEGPAVCLPITAATGHNALPFVILTGAKHSGEISVWMLFLGNIFPQSAREAFPGRTGEPQISPLRFAPVKMTKGRVVMARNRLAGEPCGIPHLAKNERDVGHPAVVARIEL